MKSNKKYDLEMRTFQYASNVIQFVDALKKTISNVELSRQLIRSSGSVGANYIEANESVSQKDFIYRIKICRKEAKESLYWLRLISCKENQMTEKEKLMKEALELTKIFGAIVYRFYANRRGELIIK
ncbi:MAG: four helix bundle protein [Balneolaceae bacterium]|nr:four helix bundle protein [Balneolaceae bacterium]